MPQLFLISKPPIARTKWYSGHLSMSKLDKVYYALAQHVYATRQLIFYIYCMVQGKIFLHKHNVFRLGRLDQSTVCLGSVSYTHLTLPTILRV